MRGNQDLALGRLPAGQMNKTEARYAAQLEELKSAGGILWWKFEPMKLRLAPNTTYSPDFLILWPDRTMTFSEVKGFWREDAKVKIKVAAETFPMFEFRVVRLVKGKFVEEVISK